MQAGLRAMEDQSDSRIVKTETLLTVSRFSVQRVTQRLLDGNLHQREVVKHPGAVVVLPVLDDGRICLIRNYRVAVDQELLELPAGTLEPEIPPITQAQRELAEETGFRCTSIAPLCEFYMSPGILDEHMYAFVARGLSLGEAARETGEEMENALYSPDALRELIRQNQIRDAKTLAVLLQYLGGFFE